MQTPIFEPQDKLNYGAQQLAYLTGTRWDIYLNQFLDRMAYHHVKHCKKYDAYRSDEYLQTLIQDVYGLDAEKFWYFILFAADYATDKGVWINCSSPKEQLDRAFSLINDNLNQNKIPQLGFDFDYDKKMKLTLTVKERGRKKNTLAVIDSANAMAFLSILYGNIDESKYSEFLNLTRVSSFGTDTHASPTQMIACFTKILEEFLSGTKAKLGVKLKGTWTSKSIMSLISQCIYVLQLTGKVPNSYNHSPATFLRGQIKQFKNMNPEDGDNLSYALSPD